MSTAKQLQRFLAAIGLSLVVGIITMVVSAVVLAIVGIYMSGHSMQTPQWAIDWGPVQLEFPGMVMMIATVTTMALTFATVVFLTRSKRKNK